MVKTGGRGPDTREPDTRGPDTRGPDTRGPDTMVRLPVGPLLPPRPAAPATPREPAAGRPAEPGPAANRTIGNGATSGNGVAVAAPDRPPGPETATPPEDPRPGSAPPEDARGGRQISFSGARTELRRQLQEQKRVRAIAMAVVVATLLGAPMLYFGILFAARDPALNSLDRLEVPQWAAQSAEDRIISGSRWCFIDCRLRERTLLSDRDVPETTQAYQTALVDGGWQRWDVAGCPLAEVDGDYTCWTRDEYTLDLWVRPPECAYDPLNLRPDVPVQEEDGDEGEADPEGAGEECRGSVVEIKMQNRVADERGRGAENGAPGGGPTAEPTGPPGTPDPEATGAPPTEPAGDDG